VVTGTYSDASHQVETITTGNVSGFSSAVATTGQVLTVTFEGKTTTYTVDIVNPTTPTDTTPPTGGSLSYFDGWRTHVPARASGEFETIGITSFSDSSGIASQSLELYKAPLNNGVCGSFVLSPSATQNIGVGTISIGFDDYAGMLEDGYCHQFKFSATDNAGNSASFTSPSILKYDTTAPSVIIDSAVKSSTKLYATWTGTDSQSGISSYMYKLYGGSCGSLSDIGQSWNMDITTNSFLIDTISGVGAVEFKATNNAGLGGATSAPVCHDFVSDTSAPTASITSPTAGSTLSGNVTITANASDSGSGVAKVEFWVASVGIKIGTDTTAPYSADWNTTSFGDGSHQLWLTAYDNVGNYLNTTAITVNVNNDSIPPTVGTVSISPSSKLYSGSPNYVGTGITLSATASDANGVTGCEYTIDGGATWNAASYSGGVCTSPTINSGISTNTSYTFNFRASDAAGNKGVGTALTALGDIQNATLSLVTPDGASTNGSINLQYIPDDVGSGLAKCELYWNYPAGGSLVLAGTENAPNPDVVNQFVKTGLTTDGTFTWDVACYDNVGYSGWGNFPSHQTFTVDSTAPTATVSYDVTTPTKGSVVATLHPSEPVTGDTTHTFTNNGSFTFNFTDTAGNTGSTTATVSNIDKTVPTVVSVDSDGQTYSGSTSSSSTSSPHTIKITFSEDIVNTPHVEVHTVVTGETINNCSDADAKTFCFNYTIPASQEATHTIWISDATDAAGNTMSLDSSHTFVVDTKIPTASITSPSAGSYLKGTVTITANASDLGSGVQKVEFYHSSPVGVLMGTDTTAPYSIDWNTTSVTDGNHNIWVAVYDNAGNHQDYLTVTTVTVDNTAPVVLGITSPKDNGTYTTGTIIPVTLRFSEPVNVTYGQGACYQWQTLLPGIPCVGWLDAYPYLTLETGTTDRNADYVSGSGTNTLTFNYTVQSGDTSSDLDYTSNSSLQLNGGTIRDAATNDANLALPNPNETNSLGANKNIVIDANAPVITLKGNNPQTIELGAGYTELGATTDDGSEISINTSAFTDAVGSYSITYNATDTAGNIAEQKTRTVNVVDTTAPELTSAVTKDLNGNGKIDAIELTFNETIDRSRLAESGNDGWAVDGYTVLGVNTSNNENDNVLILSLNEKSALDTDVTPTVTYTATSLPETESTHDLAGNQLDSDNWRSIDGVAPKIVSIYETATNKIEVTFSEALQNNPEGHYPKPEDFRVYNGESYNEDGSNSYGISSVSYSNKIITITLENPIKAGDNPHLDILPPSQPPIFTSVIDLSDNYFVAKSEYDHKIYDNLPPVTSSEGGGHILVGQVLGASTGPIDGCGNRTTGFSITTGQSCVGNTGNGQVLGAEKFIFTLFLKMGSHGNEVMELQKFLNNAGYGILVVDGRFGARTKAALIKFQIANGLRGDGVVGAKTREILNK
jgi:hypothetical protein